MNLPNSYVEDPPPKGKTTPSDRSIPAAGWPSNAFFPLKPTLVDGLLVGALGTILLFVLSTIVPHGHAPYGDELIYERMAIDPFGTHTFPFGFRIGIPSIVHFLPFSHSFSFALLALQTAGASGGVLTVLLSRFNVPRALSFALGICLVISPTIFVAMMRGGRNVDPETVLVMLLATLFIVDKRPVALGITLILGALLRESSMFLIPFAYAVWAQRFWDKDVAKRVFLLCLPAASIYCLLRLQISTVGKEQVIGYGQGFLSQRLDVLKTGFNEGIVELRRIFFAFGPLWLVAPFGLNYSFVRRSLVLVIPLLFALTFALDWSRVLFLAAPVIYIASGLVLKNRPRVAIATILILMAVNLSYIAYLWNGGIANITDGSAPRYIVQ